MKCPHCGEEVNAAKELARQGSAKLTPEQRKARSLLALDRRWSKVRGEKKRKEVVKKLMNARMGEFIKVMEERDNEKNV